MVSKEDEMRYDEFRDQLQNALHNVGLFGQRIGNPVETVDLYTMRRHWKVYVLGPAVANSEPFHVTAKIAFDWSPFDSARSYTCEEDLLAELFGQTKRPSKTEQRFTRVDLGLHARLPYGSTTSIPEAPTFSSWADSIKQKLDTVFAESKWRQGQLAAVLGWLDEIDIATKCNSAGVLSVKGLSIAGFRMVRVPRVWDDPDRRDAEKGAAAELSRLAQKFKYSLDEWSKSIAELARWIRYTPPPLETKRVAPPFEDQEDENEEDGPGTIH